MEGSYTVHYGFPSDRGTCAISQAPADAKAIVTVSGTHANVAFEGRAGSCPAVIDGCKLSAICDLTNQKTTRVGSLSLSWTFSAAGFSGSSHATVPLDDGTTCELNETESSH